MTAPCATPKGNLVPPDQDIGGINRGIM